MVQLPTGPTITCGFGYVPVAVVATYAGGTVPISGAKVTFKAAFFGFYGGGDVFYTDPLGIAQNCYILSAIGLGAFIQKDGIDFGSGVGVEHFIGDSGIRTGPYMFPKVVARTALAPPTPPKLPCSGFMSVSLPNFSQLLSGPQLPGSIPFILSITGTGLPENIPLSILVDGRQVTTASGDANSSVNIDLLTIIRTMGVAELNSGHTVVIRSNLPDCYIPQTSFDIPPFVPAALPCSGLISIVQPTFVSLLSGPALPPSIPVPVSITGTNLPPSIPLSILVDGTQVTTATGIRNGSINIDVLSIIGPAARNTGHTIDIRSTLPDCNISPASLPVPELIPALISGLPPQLAIELGKQAKILSYPAGAALEAYDGQEVTITAGVTCGLSPSSGEPAIFLVDGNEISRGITSQGFVSFKWTATPEPSRTHRICVSVPKSDQCPKYGEARDCKTITVSRVVPGIEEQLRKEREAYLLMLQATRAERERIRELTTIPALTPPTITPTPAIVTPLPTITPIQPPITGPSPGPVTGIISIPSVKIPPGVEFPIEIYIDGQLIGPPPVYREVSPGTHTLRIQLKGFTPISLVIDVPAGGVKTIEESFI